MPSQFENALKFGDAQQTKLQAWLIRQGCVVQPCNATPTGGARIFGPGLEVANPDMIVFREKFPQIGQLSILPTFKGMSFVEVKAKSSFTYHRLSKQWQTGIDAKAFDGYVKSQDASGLQVWLFFLQQSGQTDKASMPYGESPSGIYCQRIDELCNGRRRSMTKNGRQVPMIYWPERRLIKLAPVEDLD